MPTRPVHATAKGDVPFTDAEIAQQQVEEAAWVAAKNSPPPPPSKLELAAQVLALKAKVDLLT